MHAITSIEVQGESQDVFEVYADDSREQTLAFVFDETLAKALPRLTVSNAELLAALRGCVGYLRALPVRYRPDAAWFLPADQALANAINEPEASA